MFFCLLSSSAVRFGRIPKREKQRLLDEMQSYMNSLNESASMEMGGSSPPDNPCSPQNQTNDVSGPTLQFYCSDEKPLKMAVGSSNLTTPSFQSAAAQDGAPSHTSAQMQHMVQVKQGNLTTGYHVPTNLPVSSSSGDSPANINVDNAKYTFSSNQNQCPVSGHLSPHTYPSSQNGFRASDFQNQNSCPWKLNGGAKVLVSFLLLLSKQQKYVKWMSEH